MTIIQLEYLLAVANCGSFSQASEVCFVTQPSLSMQIKNLEEELGVILLDRSKKPVVPTETGKLVIAQAREAIKAYEQVREVVNETKGEVSGTLRLGVIPTIAPYLLHLFLPDFAKNNPKVELEIHEMVTAEIIKALDKDGIDAAIVAGGTCRGNVNEDELFNDRFYAYVSTTNRLYDKNNIRIEDIDMKELLLLPDGHCIRDQILELCHAAKQANTSYCFECGSLETIMRIVDSTSAMTIVPEMATQFITDDRRSQLKPLAKGAMSRKIAIAVRRTYVKTSLICALKDSIMRVIPVAVS